MNNECYNAVINEMQVLLDGQKFVKDGDIYKNDSRAVKVYYDGEKQTFNLGIAEVTDGEVGEFSVANSWLFEENQTAKDAAAVGTDFADTLRTTLGIKKSVRNSSSDIALPTADKGDEITVLSLTQKLLAIFPQYKEVYKQDVARYGKYLYIDFISRNFIPEIKRLVAGGAANRRQLKKIFDMLDEMYVKGDSATSDMVVMIIAACSYENTEAYEAVKGYIESDKHLVTSVDGVLKEFKGNRKLREALIK